MCLGDGLDIKEARVVQNTKAANPLFHFLSSYILGIKVSPVKNKRRNDKMGRDIYHKRNPAMCVDSSHSQRRPLLAKLAVISRARLKRLRSYLAQLNSYTASVDGRRSSPVGILMGSLQRNPFESTIYVLV